MANPIYIPFHLIHSNSIETLLGTNASSFPGIFFLFPPLVKGIKMYVFSQVDHAEFNRKAIYWNAMWMEINMITVSGNREEGGGNSLSCAIDSDY